ncbi:hypothetical protein [Kineococcus radiotolerans]|uniref:Uncharacterized protein n=1 Tax=Kineococcus radiotolerans (strain ATCC BAA-149 / DSM 14245 / SRS30216) TaxID=266940 RepID=A6W8W9_KINRD|nr:hypothetical protein [Kineococcus radiotolerans]ABS03258.1 hypothetical protein Krad_1772 [Kineococcus radiotolerans SRS30216 = ATCC BAA-149]
MSAHPNEGHGTLDILEALAALPEPEPPRPPAPKPAGPLVAAICALMNGDPIHDRDRERIVDAIVDDALTHDGLVNPNRVRTSLTRTNADGSTDLVVYPRLIGTVYQTLAAKGALEFVDWTDSTDLRGGNKGKPARIYRLTRILEPTP